MPTLTLCLIARDEERFIRDCLSSVRGVVDQIIVVDTGSRDRTRARASAAGATVISHPWQDDFAAARNAALPHVTGDWILVLDADERLAPGAGRSLRRAVARGGFDCGLLPLHNAARLDATPKEVLSGRVRLDEPMVLPRLLRRDPALRWWGAIHESVGPWVAAGRRVQLVDAAIVHYGAVPELRKARDKGTRNRALLERHLAREPGDAWARSYFAWELLDHGDAARATRQAEWAWTDAVAAKDGGDTLGRARDLSQAATLRAFTLLRDGHALRSVQVLDEATARAARHPNLALLRASALDTLVDVDPADLLAAVAGLEAARARHGEIFAIGLMPGATSWAAATLAGALLTRLGEPTQAIAVLDQALAERPDHWPAHLAKSEALAALGQGELALAAAEPALAEDSADAWTVAAVAAYGAGATDVARNFGRRARSAERLGWACLRRQQALSTLEAALAAATQLVRLVGPMAPAPDPGAATLRAAAALAASQPAVAVQHAAEAIAGAPGDSDAWAILGQALVVAGLPDQGEQALRTCLSLRPQHPDARTALAQHLGQLGHHGEAARHWRAAGQAPLAPPADPPGVGHPGAATLTVFVRAAAGDEDDLAVLLDHLALQDPSAGAFEVVIAGPMPLLTDPTTEPRPFPVVSGADNPATAGAGALVLILGVDRLPPPGLLGGHRAAHAAPNASPAPSARAVVGGGGVEALDATTELDTVIAASDLAKASPPWPFGPPPSWHDHVSAPREAWAADVMTVVGDPSLLAPRARAPSITALRAQAAEKGRAQAASAPRQRTLDALEAALASRTAVEDGRRKAARMVGALERTASRVSTPTGDALATRVDALQTVLRADRATAEATVTAGRATGTGPLIDRLTSVIMLNLNGQGHLQGAIESLRRHTTGPVEVIVVDNGSTDESLPWLRAQGDVVLREMGENVGAPAGRNRGLEIARGDSVLFCDNDVVFTPQWRELMLTHLDAWPDIGAVGPMSDVVVGGQLVDHEPGPNDDIAAWGEQWTKNHRGQSQWVLRLILFCVMMRREAIEEVGGIDPRYGRWGFEDDDLSLRLARAGWHQRIARDCFIQHLGSRTSKSANLDYQALLIQNWERFKARWGLSPDLPYGSAVDLDAVLAEDWDPTRDFVPFRLPGWSAPAGPLRLIRWGQ
jgi:glycosyltransferase involved in cell wall biosynthesis/tetratricopeptide (TPR) repeat protein